jgi:hypothetical protein
MANDMLRAHVTGTAFHLTLGKTHIAALVHLEEVLAYEEEHGATSRRERPRDRSREHAALGNFVTGATGLLMRGLVTHTPPPPRTRTDTQPFVDFWQITTAGRLVLELLREAGIWQEYATNPAGAQVAA